MSHERMRVMKGGDNAGRHNFTFDRCFDMSSRQQDIFEYSIKSTVDDVLNGYNGTVFAYGQTGSGKTFTMMVSRIWHC
jgi:kinesin family member 5